MSVRFVAAPGGHAVRTVTRDWDAAGNEIRSRFVWASCDCLEHFMGENDEDLTRQIVAHFEEAAKCRRDHPSSA